jgi:hypothetical protein
MDMVMLVSSIDEDEFRLVIDGGQGIACCRYTLAYVYPL